MHSKQIVSLQTTISSKAWSWAQTSIMSSYNQTRGAVTHLSDQQCPAPWSTFQAIWNSDLTTASSLRVQVHNSHSKRDEAVLAPMRPHRCKNLLTNDHSLSNFRFFKRINLPQFSISHRTEYGLSWCKSQWYFADIIPRNASVGLNRYLVWA